MVVNNWFSQKLSNTLGIEVIRPKIIETTSLGAAFLAGLQAGVFEDFRSLEDSKRVDRTFIPIEEESRYKEWKEAVGKTLT